MQHHPLPPQPHLQASSTLHPASKVQSCSLLVKACSLCDCCVREGLRLLAGIPPQLSGRLRAVHAACLLLLLAFCWAATSFPPVSAVPAKAATKTQRNATRQHLPIIASHRPSAPCEQAPVAPLPPAPHPLHSCAGPPLSAESSTRLPESLPIWGCRCPAHPGVACPVGLVWSCSFLSCSHCLALKLI